MTDAASKSERVADQHSTHGQVENNTLAVRKLVAAAVVASHLAPSRAGKLKLELKLDGWRRKLP